ncbi:MAG: TonB-dependent receptor [candidate division WOR-3 bacterium]
MTNRAQVRIPSLTLLASVLFFVVFRLGLGAEPGAVSGFVRDASNGEPLAYANVYLEGTGLGAATSDKGYYYIGHVPPGSYELVASFVGYQTVRRRVTVGMSQTVKADIELGPGAIELGEVKVTADRARFEREVEVSVVRLDTRRLQLVPKVGGEVDLFRTIQSLPGVVATSDFSNRLYIRGGSPDQNLVLLDGITLYNPSHLFGMFSPFVPEAVSDVTLLAGGFPARYGSRLSSVLDVTTKEGNSKRLTGDASVSMLAAKAQLEGPIPRGSFLVAGRRTYLPDLLLAAFDVKGIGYYFYDVMGKVNYEPWPDSRFTLAGIGAEDVLNFWDPDNRTALDARLRWGNRGVSLRWNRVFTPVLYGEVMTAWSNFHTLMAAQFGAPDKAEMSAEITDLMSKAEMTWYAADRHTVDFGIDVRCDREYMCFSFGRLGFDTTTSYWPVGLYVDEKWELVAKKLYVKPGLRLSYYSLGNRVSPEPRASVKYLPAKNTAINAALGRFTQPVVTMNSTDAVFSIYDVWIPVQEYHRLPEAWHYVAGVEQWLSRDLTVSLEGYYKDYNHLLETRYGRIFTRPDSLLEADGYSYGADLMLRKTEGWYNGWLSYSYMWTRRGIGSESYHPHYDRRHSVNLVVNFPRLVWGVDLSAKWTLGSGLPYAGIIGYYSRYNYHPLENGVKLWQGFIEGPRDAFRYPVYHRADVGLSRAWPARWGEVTVFLDVTNAYYARNVLLYYWEVPKTGLPERKSVGMLPILPSLGVKVRF